MKKLITLFSILAIAGCGESSTSEPTTAAVDSSAPRIDGTAFVLGEEPEAASDVVKVREEAKDGDDIIVVGRIGGSSDPWIDGRAVFSIVDLAAKPCNEIEGDKCPIPWDYCCEDKLASKTALVKFVDDSDRPLAAGAKDLFGVKELDTVVIKGKAKRDDAGNLTVLASGMFVRK